MKKLLLIDDEFIFRQGLKYMLEWETYGYTIVGEASNGQEGLEKYLLLKPDIILCDVVMPVMNGVEFVGKIQKCSGSPVVMLSNFDEFDKVRQAFQYGAADYLLKSRVTKELLLQCLDRITTVPSVRAPQNYNKTFGVLARQVLDGYAGSCSPEFTSYVKTRLPSHNYILLVIDSPQPDFSGEQSFQAALEDLIDGVPFQSCYTSQHHAIALITSDSPEAPPWLSSFVNTLSHQLRYTSSAVSTPFSDLSLFKEKTEYIYDLSKYSILFDRKFCFYESEILSETPAISVFPSDLYTAYTSTGHWEQAYQLLLDYISQIKNTMHMNPYKFKKFVEHTFYSSLKDARRLSDNSFLIGKIELKLFKQLDCAVTYIQIQDAIALAYGELDSLCTSKQEDHIIAALHTYLQRNYSKQLSLYDVAEHLHMNYSYLSAYISQKTGKRFSEHLNDIRIEHARHLLASSSQSISQISEALGYTDQSYFGKIFKKAVGMTPLQYRNQLVKDEHHD